MQRSVSIKALAFVLAYLMMAGVAISAQATTKNSVSGKIVNGYRLLPIKEAASEVEFTVYRGDYIKFVINAAKGQPLLKMPELKYEKKLNADLTMAPYFKMKKVGVYKFSVGKIKGRVNVVEYSQGKYTAVSAEKAAQIIKKESPLLLDVRTTREFNHARIANATLIPVQDLQQRIDELIRYKNSTVVIYCATGNRSTVASKILIDHGFKRVVNMRHGIYQWAESGLPIVQ